MHCTLKNDCSKYFYILSIFIFIITVDCANESLTPAIKKDANHFKLRNIRKLSFDEWDNFCKSFDTVLANVDALFNGISNVNKANVKALKQLENANKKIIFFTSTMDTIDNLAEKLRTLGYTTDFELFNPITALKWYLDKIRISGKVYVIGDEKFKEMIKSLDIEIIHHVSMNTSDEVTFDEYIAGYNDTLDDDVKAVIIGFDANINLYKITRALCYLKNSNVQLFLTQPKPIYGYNYFNAWIKKMIKETNRTKQYIDRLDGIFGDFLVEKNGLKDLKDKVLHITSNSVSGSRNFTVQNNFKPLLIGSYKIKKEVTVSTTYYYVNNIAQMPACSNDE